MDGMKSGPVLFRDGVRPVVVRGLDNGEERFPLLPQYLRRLEEKVLVADPPHVDFRRAVILLLIQMQAVYIVGQQAADICPAGASAQEIELLISAEIVDDRMLVHCRRISAGRTGCGRYVRYAGDHGPYAPGRSVTGRETMIEKPSAPAKTVEAPRRVQGIPPHRALIPAERFADHEDDIWPGTPLPRTPLPRTLLRRTRLFRTRFSRLRFPRVVSFIPPGPAKIRRQQRIGRLNLRIVVTGMPELQAAEKGLKGIQRQVGLIVAAQAERIAPSQRILSDPAEDRQAEQQKGYRRPGDPRPAGKRPRPVPTESPVNQRSDPSHQPRSGDKQ